MAATYSDALTANRDQVRFLVGDTDVDPETDAQLTDGEYDWILTEQSNVYLAAARALSILLGRWMSRGQGIAEKQVSKLRIKWGMSDGEASMTTIENRIAELRSLGMPKRARQFRVVRG